MVFTNVFISSFCSEFASFLFELDCAEFLFYTTVLLFICFDWIPLFIYKSKDSNILPSIFFCCF